MSNIILKYTFSPMIKVLIVDDQKTVQEILRSYIEEDSRLELVGSAGNGQEAWIWSRLIDPISF